MKRYYYSDSIADFLKKTPEEIIGTLTLNSEFAVQHPQRDSWLAEVEILRKVLGLYEGTLYLEYSIPRIGRRIDAVVLLGPMVLVLEFKIGESKATTSATNQVWDYALDLKNFHESSRDCYVVPILITTHNSSANFSIVTTLHNDKVLFPIRCNSESLPEVITQLRSFADGDDVRSHEWEEGRYSPTPTIIEAAMALYRGHSVSEISRNDASAINLSITAEAISEIISRSREQSHKSICFVTGVPGAGKTLVGLSVATEHQDKSNSLYSVFLSGNGPLVKILREALARDRVRSEKEQGKRIRKGEAMSEVKAFIQNVHNFRDECIVDSRPPIEHVALFDEAQRAWNLKQTSNFMQRKKNTPNFNVSEPEFLISCLDRHKDWAVIVCLVGGGQEINTGEAGISEWIEAIKKSYPNWHVFISSRLVDSEYGTGKVLLDLTSHVFTEIKDELHLAVSMRSFRAENVSLLVKQLLDLKEREAQQTLSSLRGKYPIVISRDLTKAKQWLRKQARGSERYGIVVSSQAERLKPHAIDVRSPMDPIHWFLDGPEDVRSSFYLEDVATEFDVQGLELDWACVTWDGDFRYSQNGWKQRSFKGNKWTHIQNEERRRYQKNAYRVLLTRARQGMVIVVPSGDTSDWTRKPEYYDPTYRYLQMIGFDEI